VFQKRIIICLDVRNGKTTKGIRFRDNADIGDPVEMAERYYRQGVDELVFYDIAASHERRGIMIDVVRRVAERIFIPFCVGGGIASVDDMSEAIMAGAEKVSVNSAAARNPAIIEDGASRYGSQCIVLGLDAAADNSMPSGYGVFVDGGRVRIGRDMLEWAREAVDRGVGEIVLNSIDADGVRDGYELRATRMLSEAVGVPVVASGGAGTPEHIIEVLGPGKADAALIASMVHYGNYTIAHIKEEVAASGIPIRQDMLSRLS